MKLGTRFLRIAAAGIPEAALGFVPHGDEAKHACCRQCGHDHPVLVDEYYFWLVDSKFYAYTDAQTRRAIPTSHSAAATSSAFRTRTTTLPTAVRGME